MLNRAHTPPISSHLVPRPRPCCGAEQVRTLWSPGTTPPGQSSLLSHGEVSIALEAQSSKDNHSSQQAHDQWKEGTGLSWKVRWKQRRAWPCGNYRYLCLPPDALRPSPTSNPHGILTQSSEGRGCMGRGMTLQEKVLVGREDLSWGSGQSEGRVTGLPGNPGGVKCGGHILEDSERPPTHRWG